MSTLFTVLTFGAVAVLGYFVAEKVARAPKFGIYLILLEVIETLFLEPGRDAVQIGSFTVTFSDAVAVILLFSMFFAKGTGRQSFQQPVFILTFLFILSVTRGTLIYGFSTAVNESRSMILVLTILIWSSSVSWVSEERSRKLMTAFAVSAAIVCLFAVLRLAMSGFHVYGELVLAADASTVDPRALNSAQTFLLLPVFLYLFSRLLRVTGSKYLKVERLATLFIFGVIVVSQQRTIWLSLAFSVFLILALNILRFKAGKFFSMVAIGLGSYFGFTILQANYANFLTGVQSQGTVDARVQGWEYLLDQVGSSSLIDILIGHPFGGGFARYQTGVFVTFQPHNWYVLLVTRVGIIGLLAYCWLLLFAIWKSLQKGTPNSARAGILVAGLVFGFGYNVTPVFALLLSAIGFVDSDENHFLNNWAQNSSVKRIQSKGLKTPGLIIGDRRAP